MQNLYCKCGFHKWIYSKQEFILKFQLPPNLSHSSSSYPNKSMIYTVRLCRICYKKQRVNSDNSSRWVKCDLTKIENRDMKLDTLI